MPRPSAVRGSSTSEAEAAKRAERALEVFQTLHQQGIVPCTITYNALISAWHRLQNDTIQLKTSNFKPSLLPVELWAKKNKKF